MPDRKYIAVSAVLLVLICYALLVGRQGPFVEVIDYGEHAASILEMSENLFSPQNPMLSLSGDTTLRYTPYIFIAGLIKKILNLNLETTLAFISVLSFIILIAGVYLFSIQYFRNRDMPVYLLTVLLFFWGRPFIYSNDYSFNFLVYTLFYPSIIVFNLSFIGFYLLLILQKNPKIKYLLVYMALSVFLFQTHPLTASFYFLTSILIAVTGEEHRYRTLTVILCALVISFIIALLWPYYPFLQSFNNSMTSEWYPQDFKWLYDPFNILLGAGPIFIGVPLVFRLLLKRQKMLIPSGCFACLFIYTVSFLFDINLGERYIFFILFFLHLSIADYMCFMKVFSFNTWRNLFSFPFLRTVQILLFTALLTAGTVVHAGNTVLQQCGYSLKLAPPFVHRYSDPLANYRGLRPYLQRGDVVLSDPLSMWLLPSVTGVNLVALYHDNPLVPDNNQRIRDVLVFYNSDSSFEIRKSIVEKYSVSHILLNLNRGYNNLTDGTNLSLYNTDFMTDEDFLIDMSKMGELVFENHGFLLFKLGDI